MYLGKARYGLRFLGVWVYKNGVRLQKKTWDKIHNRLDSRNRGSYRGLVIKHDTKRIKEFDWMKNVY